MKNLGSIGKLYDMVIEQFATMKDKKMAFILQCVKCYSPPLSVASLRIIQGKQNVAVRC